MLGCWKREKMGKGKNRLLLRSLLLLVVASLMFFEPVYAAGENWEIMRGIYLALYAAMGFVVIILYYHCLPSARNQEQLTKLKGKFS